MPRRLLAALLAVAALPTATATAGTTSLEAETLGPPVSDATASGGHALLLSTNGTATGILSTTAARRLVVRARGDQCAGAPRMTVAVDGRTVLDTPVATAWTGYGVDAGLANGAHTIAISFTNDAHTTTCDRNLRVDKLTASSTAAAPFAGRRFYVDPAGAARTQADAWRTTRPADAALMDKIGAQPDALWLGGWNADVTAAAKARVDAAQAAGAVPVLVAYDIPQRDCGLYSAGGAFSADAYRTWIRAVAAGIGSRPAAVLLEPDALAGIDCLSAADRDRRLALVRDAVSVLTALPRTSVYLDGGHARWQPAATMAARLSSAGVADAQGFFLNVSAFVSSAENATYGTDLAARTGGKHFVIDTSRNGLGPAPDGQWCNPPGRALGARPSTSPGVWRQDASLWVKHPGESDGPCNGGPAAGQWWAEYALGLAQRATW